MDKGAIEHHIEGIIRAIEGELRSGTLETPRRVASAYEEMLDGYNTDIDSLFKTFDGEGTDQIVCAKDIIAWSLCEHHILPFCCRIHIAYLPVDRVIGASKLERVAMAYAHRLQLQERIAQQIGDSIMENLKPQGAGVIIEGIHCCMRCRGIKTSTGTIINSVMLGAFRKESGVRMEVLTLLGLNNKINY